MLTLRPEDELKRHYLCIQHLFARVFEIDRNLAVDRRLHLTQSPVGAVGVAHQHAGVQNGAQTLL